MIRGYKVTRDGKELYRGTESECWAWLLRNVSGNVHHATKYEGYKIQAIKREVAPSKKEG